MAKRRNLERKARLRRQRTVILIIGEGQTEEAYFKAVRQQRFELPSLHIEIEPADCKSDPINLARKALSKPVGDYDHILCVLDGDKPEQLAKARKQFAKRQEVQAFASTPCFEVWLTLHFERSDAAMPDCQQAETRLKRHWPDYAKGCGCDSLIARLDDACANARWLEQQELPNPCTELHHLIEVLETALKES